MNDLIKEAKHKAKFKLRTSSDTLKLMLIPMLPVLDSKVATRLHSLRLFRNIVKEVKSCLGLVLSTFAMPCKCLHDQC